MVNQVEKKEKISLRKLGEFLKHLSSLTKGGSLHSRSQVLCLQVRIALKHLQSLMPRDRGHFHDIKSFLEESTGGLVAKIMKGQIEQVRGIRFLSLLFTFFFVGFPGTGECPPPGDCDCLGREHVPDFPIDTVGEAGEEYFL